MAVSIYGIKACRPYQKMQSSIFALDLARGIKDMLITNGFTSLDAISKMPPAELALILGIDLYVARLIYLSAKRHGQIERLQRQINDEEMNNKSEGTLERRGTQKPM